MTCNLETKNRTVIHVPSGVRTRGPVCSRLIWYRPYINNIHGLRKWTGFMEVRWFIVTIHVPKYKTLICGTKKKCSFGHHVHIISAAHWASCLVWPAGSSGVKRHLPASKIKKPLIYTAAAREHILNVQSQLYLQWP